MRMSARDPYHAFLVMSFVSETRVLSVGLSFDDVTVRKPAVLAYAPVWLEHPVPWLCWLILVHPMVVRTSLAASCEEVPFWPLRCDRIS
jgi:hypothetical protein